ncbi:MAG TPA: hypothetical protein PLN69_09520 [bacterium]|nr:hypothetical protein [bacterium]
MRVWLPACKGFLVFCFALLFIGVAVKAVAQDELIGQPIDVNAAVENVETMLKLGEERGENYRQEINRLIDLTLHILRGPYLDGSDYKYAEAVMDDDQEPEILLSEKVDAVWEVGQQQAFDAEARTVYGLQISSPKYRSGLFKNNGDTYIESYRVEFSINGKKRTITREHKDWVRRNAQLEIPLPGIAEWAKIEILAGVAPSDVNHTIVEITGRHPVIKDDPKNPFSYSVEQMKSLQKNIAYARQEVLMEKLTETLKGIEAVPTATSANLSADKRIVQKLEYILYLLEGNEVEREEAKKELKDLTEALK